MTDLTATQRARRRQVLTAIGVATGIFGVAALGVWLTDSGAPAPTGVKDGTTRSYIAPGDSLSPEDAWRGVSDSRLSTIEDKVKQLETQDRDLRQTLTQQAKQAAPANDSIEALDARLRDYERNVAHQYPPGSPAHPEAALAAANPLPRPQAALASQTTATSGSMPADATVAPRAAITTVRLRTAAAAPTSVPAGAPSSPARAVRTTDTYLPAGMFGQGTLLSGLDAPTGGQAQSNPHPVLLQLTDLAVLPNRYRYDWKSCHLIGAGYGDLSSERAYIRTETLSCVAADGRVLNVPVKGYIVGEDGKAGLRGRLVSKQGQVLGNALLAGVVGGIGTGLERAATLQSVSPLGSTSTAKPGEEFQQGIGNGIGRSLDRLAAYYIALAEKMFPVIEVDAGRVADIILTEGVSTDDHASDPKR